VFCVAEAALCHKHEVFWRGNRPFSGRPDPAGVRPLLAQAMLLFMGGGNQPLLTNEETSMKIKKTLRVSLAFARYNKDLLNCFVLLVLMCQKNNPLFPKPPVSLADLAGLQTTYQAALSAATLGGQAERAAFREARGALVAALRRIAAYIQSLGLTKESEVLSSGFDLAVWDTRPKPLMTPVLVRLDNSFSTQLSLKLRAVANARVYEVQFSDDGGQTWQRLGIYPHTKGIMLAGVTPGKVYALRVRAVGGSRRYSDWSNAIACMAT
jgi:hypothetical protein